VLLTFSENQAIKKSSIFFEIEKLNSRSKGHQLLTVPHSYQQNFVDDIQAETSESHLPYLSLTLELQSFGSLRKFFFLLAQFSMSQSSK
jgi:hypothetical protein